MLSVKYGRRACWTLSSRCWGSATLSDKEPLQTCRIHLSVHLSIHHISFFNMAVFLVLILHSDFQFFTHFSLQNLSLYMTESLYCYFQVSKMINQVQGQVLSRPLKDIHRPKGNHFHLGHSDLRSWVLWSKFSSRVLLYFDLYNFPSILTSIQAWQISASQKHPKVWCCHHQVSP